MMRDMGMDSEGNVNMENFVEYFVEKLKMSDDREFDKIMEQFTNCARDLQTKKRRKARLDGEMATIANPLRGGRRDATTSSKAGSVHDGFVRDEEVAMEEEDPMVYTVHEILTEGAASDKEVDQEPVRERTLEVTT